MSTVFLEKDSCVFVGGSWQGSGISKAGGCTKDWLDNHGGDSSLLFGGSNGAAKVAGTSLTIDDDNRVYKSASAQNEGFYNACLALGADAIGMCAWCYDGDVWGDLGIFELTEINTQYEYVCFGDMDEAILPTGQIELYLGGAFDSVNNSSLQSFMTAYYYNVTVYSCKNETFSPTFTPSGYGSMSRNTYLVYEAYHSNVGDMSKINPFTGEKGVYYQSSVDYLINGHDSDKVITWNGGDNTHDLCYIASKSNIKYKNIRFNFLGVVAAVNYFTFSITSCYNTCLIRCFFEGQPRRHWNFIDSPTTYVEDCYHGDNAYQGFTSTGSCYLENTVISPGTRGPSGNKQFALVFEYGGFTPTIVFNRCIFVGQGQVGDENGYVYIKSVWIVINCVGYNLGGPFFAISNFDSSPYHSVISRNNILMFADGGKYIYQWNSGGSQGIVVDEYNCIAKNDGTPLGDDYCDFSAGGLSELKPDITNLQEDPKFEDKTNNEFQLTPQSPCIGAGGLDVLGLLTNIGIDQRTIRLIQKNQVL